MSKYKANINLKDKNNTLTNIFSRVKKNSRILDVGCSSGYFDKVLKEKKGCRIVGIEIDEEDAKIAEKYCDQIIVADVETENWEKELTIKKFDRIIFADLLEHLKEPEKVLERVKKYLSDVGSVLVSIPNIAHVSMRLELLNGDFIPEETGVLDNTHLKYFTKDSFLNLAKQVGFNAKWISQSSFDFPKEQIEKLLSNGGLRATKEALENLNSDDAVALQYIFELVPGAVAKTDKMEEKPIYVVRQFLKSVEKEKNNEIKYLREEISRNRGFLTYKLERKIRRLLERRPVS
jgi:methionine biosynthesis protein MetW